MIELVCADSKDVGEIERLLRAADLPLQGLHDQFPDAYVVARQAQQLVGVAGLERHGDVALLRSVTVDAARQRAGVGAALVANRLERARDGGVRAVYLLTITAAAYFTRLGFAPASRDSAPPAIAASPEFAAVCPASATCLVWHPGP